MAKITAKTALVGVAGLALVGGAWAFTSGPNDGDPTPAPTFEPWNDPIFGPDAEENAAALQMEKERNAKIVEDALLALDFLEHDGPNQERKVEGRIYIYPKYARTYNKPFFEHIGAGGSSASASDLAVARAEDPDRPPVLLANDNYEVIVDYASNKRYVIDHEREIIQEEPLVVGGSRPNTILADAEKKDPAAAKRLEGLFGQFNKPRIDPKRQFKLIGPTGQGKTTTLKELPVTCNYYAFSMSGGKVGEVCYVPIDAVDGLADIRDTLMIYPLPAAGKNDTLSRFRQFAEIGGSSRFPVSAKINYSGLDGNEYEIDFTGWKKRELQREDFLIPETYDRK